ncbi:MAG: CvpA family protein, partial [Pyrinomonadaceae bacterium]
MMTVFDFFVIALLGASVVAGALRGLIRALIATAGMVLGLIAAARCYEAAGVLLLKSGVFEST